MNPHEYLKQLHTDTTSHSGRTLYDHLCSVEEILKICRCEEAVCLAGLYHSVYGTNIFTHVTTTDREKIREIIGERAEFLAWIFCNANRPFCWFCGNHIVLRDGSFVIVDEKTLHDLQMIEGANLLEQKCGADLIATFTAKKIEINILKP